jgi:hypothetical protein
MSTKRLIRGSGCVYTSLLGPSGQPIGYEDAGETPSLEIGLEADYLESRNTCLPGSPVDVREPLTTTATVSMDTKSFKKETLARAMYGVAATVVPSTLTDLVWLPPNGVGFEVDKWYRLPNRFANVGDLVIKDNAGVGVVIASSKYTLDKTYGMIKFSDIAGFTMTALKLSGEVNKADADTNNIEIVSFANSSPKPFALMLKGDFLLEGVLYKGTVELYKVQMEPAGSIPWKTQDDFATMSLSGRCLANDQMPVDTVFGNIGHHLWIGNLG